MVVDFELAVFALAGFEQVDSVKVAEVWLHLHLA
jgi:hypothetical protein